MSLSPGVTRVDAPRPRESRADAVEQQGLPLVHDSARRLGRELTAVRRVPQVGGDSPLELLPDLAPVRRDRLARTALGLWWRKREFN